MALAEPFRVRHRVIGARRLSVPATQESAWMWNGAFFVAMLAWLSAGPSQSGAYVPWCFATAVVSFYVVVNPYRSDWLEPIKLAAFLHGMSFGLGPLLLAPDGYYRVDYLSGDEIAWLDRAAPLMFFALLGTLFGYFGLTPPPPVQQPPLHRRMPPPNTLVGGALLLIGVGAACWVVLIGSRGGIEGYLGFSGSRSDIFQGIFGGYYWGSFFMVAGLSALAAAWIHRRPWTVMAVAVLVALSYLPFQGRDEVLAPLFCALVLLHYRRAPLRLWLVLPVVLLLALLAGFLNFYRQLDEYDKRVFISDPVAGTASYVERIGDESLALLANNLEQMDSVLLALKYIDEEGVEGGHTFFDWLQPLDRLLFGDVFATESAGRIIVILADPDARYINTAASPSLMGELALNFGTTGVLLGAALWGWVLRRLQGLLRQAQQAPWILMLYPYLLWVIVKSSIDGSVLFFRIWVVVLPLLILCGLLTRPRPHVPVQRTMALGS